MGCVIVAMPKLEDANRLAVSLRKSGSCDEVHVSQTGSEVLRMAGEIETGIVVCTRRLKDMGYLELAGYLSQGFSLIVLTTDESIEILEGKMLLLIQPIKLRDLLGHIEMMSSKFYTSRKKKKGFRSAVEQRIIDDAKQLLITKNGMTEPEAFRYLQKTSMDTGRTLVESAEMVLMLKDD